MEAVARNVVVRTFDEWRDCIHARARIVHLLNGLSVDHYPRLHELLLYYNAKSRLLWNRFRRAYVCAMQPTHSHTG